MTKRCCCLRLNGTIASVCMLDRRRTAHENLILDDENDFADWEKEHMKKIFVCLIVFVLMTMCNVGVFAQNQTASPEQAQDMHKSIRKTFQKKYGKEIASSISILYGGSMNAANAKELLAQPDVDGGLIGGASLKADDFATIINAYSK